MNARYYSGNTGRFASQDPVFLAIGDYEYVKQMTGQNLQGLLTDPQNLNSYAYARNNPLVYVDPTGQFSIFAPLPNSWEVKIGNVANRAYNNNSAARFAMDHPLEIAIAANLPLEVYLGAAAVAGSMGYYGLNRLGNTCLANCSKIAEVATRQASSSYLVNSTRVLDRNGRSIYTGRVNLQSTVDAIDNGSLQPRTNSNGSMKFYRNNEGHSQLDYSNGNQYVEYNVINSGAPSNNSERILRGTVKNDMYYSSSHYDRSTSLHKVR
jgi:RHS repeat-associated protein